MHTKERFLRIFNHKEADRIPISDTVWSTTVARWQEEGMDKNTSFEEYFDLDKIVHIGIDNTPRYEKKILEKTDTYTLYTTNMGATLKSFNHLTSTPDFVDFTVKSPDIWKKAKEQMTFDKSRVNLPYIKQNYKKWKEEGAWLQLGGWFGFDITHSWMVGTERLLMAMVTEPEWVMDMFDTYLELDIQMMDYLYEQGYEFDSLRWPDDMGYKNNQFFSIDMYRELLKPTHKKAIEWAHSKGIKAHMHSCGDINPILPDLIALGLDAINPLEVKAGMDPKKIKDKYGKDIVLHGGINAVLWDKPDQIIAEIEDVIPYVMKDGGYIFASDHSIPDSVSFNDIKMIIGKIKEIGRY